MVQIFVGVGISIFVIIATALIYKNQNKKDSIYDKVTKLIENVHVRKMINILIISTVVIIDILLISLVLSMFLPNVEWGWIDRNTLITTIATIMGGFFGFIGAAVGIIGTYGAFYLGANNEKQKDENHKKVILSNLLEITILETIELVKELETFSYTYQEEQCDEICEMVKGILNKAVKNEYDYDFKENIDLILLANKSNNLPENKYGSNLQNKFIKLIETNDIQLGRFVYDDNWTTYLDSLNSSKNIQHIINWINLLRNNSQGFSVIDFLKYRNEIIRIIDAYYPEVKQENSRISREINDSIWG